MASHTATSVRSLSARSTTIDVRLCRNRCGRDEYLAWQKATASRGGARKFVKEAELYAHKVHVRLILR